MHQMNSPWLKRMSVLLASELQKAVAIRITSRRDVSLL